jgi:AcrR family transcriptional regulator
MPSQSDRVNRGPSAAAENRAAILVAARELFTTQGYQVPRSAIAKAAGIGQGVLYRHFPHRFDLAFEVFEHNLVQLEQIAAVPDDNTLQLVWDALLEMTVVDRAFVEMMVEARHQAPDYDGDRRLQAVLARALPAAINAEVVEPTVTVDDLILNWRMAYGLVATALADKGLLKEVRKALPLAAVRHLI